MIHRGIRLLVRLVSSALVSAPFFFGNVFFAPAVSAAPAITSVSYTPAPNAVYAREPVTFTANVADAAGLIYVWDFGDGESAIGDVGNNGRATHLYDKQFASTAVIRPVLRLYASTGVQPAAQYPFDIDVKPLRLPDNYNSLTLAEKAGVRDTWPFANVTRVDGPGPYATGSQIDFRANASVRGINSGFWTAEQTFQWRVADSSRTEVKADSVSVTSDAAGAFSVIIPVPGWYEITLRANQSNAVGGGYIPVYDTSSYVFFATDNPATVGDAAFSVDVTSATAPGVYSGQAEPFTFGSVNYSADAAVDGGVPPFTYIWNYPNDVPTDEQPNDFITYEVATFGRTSQLDAQFRRSGLKNIYLTVIDATFRTQTDAITHSIINTNAPAGTTPFSPTLNIASAPSPLLVTLVESNNKSLTIQIGTGLAPPAPQTYVFRATASNGTPPYQIQLSPANRTTAPCTSTATTLECEYSFSAYGTFDVVATVSDGSSPAQEESFQRNVVIQQESAGDSCATAPSLCTNESSCTSFGFVWCGNQCRASSADCGVGGGNIGADTAISTPLDPRASNYGLASTFSRVGIGQSNDLKGSIAAIINIVLGFLGVIAVIFIIFGGFRMMTAAGNEDQTASGKQAIIAGVIGLFVIFAAWGIASFVINNFSSATA
ncbi:MAG: PKD domain-containing protein [Parcubacteria group bacterium]|nr:PKD domain-containing protein [Parcubacteria group bacterium]